MKEYTCEKDIIVNGEVIIPKGKTVVFITEEDLVNKSHVEGILSDDEIITKFQSDVIVYDGPCVMEGYKKRLKYEKKTKKKLTPLQRQQEKERKDNRPWYMKFKR